MSEKELKSYNRIHGYDNPSEVEKGKVRKETKNHLKHRKKSKDLTKEMTRKISTLDDYDESDLVQVELQDEKSKKEQGNSKTHKKRYKKLDRYEEFH